MTITALRCCSSCGAPEGTRNPLVVTGAGRVHVSHVLDPADDLYGSGFAEVRPLAAIAGDALLADCGWCWAGWGNRCDTDPLGGMHVTRFDRAYRRGLISAADLAAVMATADTVPGAVIPRVLAGAAS